MKKSILIILVSNIIVIKIFAQVLTVSVSGDVNFGNYFYSISEAGNDFSNSITSESETFISVEYQSWWDYLFAPNKKWQVYLHKEDINWPQELLIETKRTGNGTKAGTWSSRNPTINHGTQYQRITNAPTYFFRGRHGIINIPLNCRLSGASIIMGAEQFETNIVLTVYDDW